MRQRTAVLLIVIILFGAAVRIVPVNTGDHYWDETVYLQHAEIITGQSPDNFNEFAFRPPLLPLLLAGVLFLTQSLIAAHVVIGLLSTLVIYMTYYLGKTLYTDEAGVMAALAVAASPVFIKHSHDILVDTVLPLFWIGASLLLYRFLTNRDTKTLVAAGSITGIAILTKFTSVVLLCAGILVLLLDNHHDDITNVWRDIGVFSIATTITLLPYLIWYRLSYGSFFGWFGQAWTLSGGADAAATYLFNMNALIGLPFLAGIVLYLVHEQVDRRTILLGTIVMSFLVPMQFIVANKEPRFLLPVVPLLAVVAGHGLARQFTDNLSIVTAVVGLALLPGLWYSPITSDTADAFEEQRLTEATYHTTFYAAQWLQDNTDPSTPVYANYDWPKLGYYSKRPIILLKHRYGFAHHLNHTMDKDGYFYYSRHGLPRINPTYDKLVTHPAFTETAAFNDTGYLFRYEVTPQ